MDDPLAGMDPRDGFRVVPQRFGDAAWLELVLYDRGVPAEGFGDPSELATREPAPLEACGELARLRPALQAVCRYLNTGGRWEELDAALARLRAEAPGGRELGGYYYVDGEPNDEGRYEHVFARRDGLGGVLWVEDSFVDRLTPRDVWGRYGAEGGAGPGPVGGEPDLPGRQGLPGPE